MLSYVLAVDLDQIQSRCSSSRKSACAPERAFGFHKNGTGSWFCFLFRQRKSLQGQRAKRSSHPYQEVVHSQSSGWGKSAGDTIKAPVSHDCIPVGVAQFQLISWVTGLLEAKADKIMLLLILLLVLQSGGGIYSLTFLMLISPAGSNLQKRQTHRRWGRWMRLSRCWSWTWRAAAPLNWQIPLQIPCCFPSRLSNSGHFSTQVGDFFKKKTALQKFRVCDHGCCFPSTYVSATTATSVLESRMSDTMVTTFSPMGGFMTPIFTTSMSFSTTVSRSVADSSSLTSNLSPTRSWIISTTSSALPEDQSCR